MIREVNDMEYMNFAIGQPYNLVVVLRIKGKMTKKKLEPIFSKLQKRHPLLHARIEINQNGIPFFTFDGVGPIPITQEERKNEETVRKEFHYQSITPFDYDNKEKPLFRITLLTTPTDFDLVLCAQHTITDGLSMAYLIRDIMDILENPDKKFEVLDAPIRNEDIFPPKIRRKIPTKSTKAKIQYFFLRIMHALFFSRKKGKENIEKYHKSDHTDLDVFSWKFSETQTTEFLKKCKQHKISVHSAICTAFLPEINSINNPVNLRNRLNFPVGESFGLYAGGTVIKSRYKKRKNFWQNAKSYQRQLIWNLRDAKVFGIHKIFSKAVPIEFLQKFGTIFVDIQSKQLPFAITNLGALDKLGIKFDIEGYSIKSFYGAVSTTLDAIIILVFTMRKEMHFHLHYMTNHHDVEEMREISNNATLRIHNS